MNPCPCGFWGHPDKPCAVRRFNAIVYRNKISGPLRDRIDMHIDVPAQRYKDLHGSKEGGEESAVIRQRVKQAMIAAASTIWQGEDK